jgi:hypothetical protein
MDLDLGAVLRGRLYTSRRHGLWLRGQKLVIHSILEPHFKYVNSLFLDQQLL